MVLPAQSGRIPIASFCVEQGRWTARGKEDAKTFSGTMEEIDPMTGKKSKMRDVVRLVDNDHQVQEMFSTPEGSGKETKMMEIHYQRVKK